MKADGTIDKYKARLVIKGYRQREGLDYFDTYSPVTRITSIRIILDIAALRNWEIHQMDVKTAFLNGDLEEEIYMNQPEGFIAPGQEGKVCRLLSHVWLKASFPQRGIKSFVKPCGESGFQINEYDKCVSYELNGLVLSQAHYVDKILNTHNAGDSGQARTPIDTSTRPDLAYAVSRLSRYTSNPSYAHWKAITRVLHYLRYSRDYGLHYDRHPAVIEGYSDANWISDIKDSRSTSGYVFTLGGAAISWKSSKQTVIAKSTMESEFIALDKCGEEAEWLRQFVEDIPRWPKPVTAISIHCDSKSAMGRAKSTMYNGKSRHIRRRHNSIRQLLSTGVISIDYVASKDNIADPFTKGLSRELVSRYVRSGCTTTLNVVPWKTDGESVLREATTCELLPSLATNIGLDIRELDSKRHLLWNTLEFFEKHCCLLPDKAAIKEALIVSCAMMKTEIYGIDVRNLSVQATPAPVSGSSNNYCARIFVNGKSRLNLGSYARPYRVLMALSRAVHHRLRDKCHRDDAIRYVLLAVGISLLLFARVVSKYLFSKDVDGVKSQFIERVMSVIGLACTFEMMKEGGVRPNVVMVVSVVAACAALGSLSLCKWVHSYVEARRDITIQGNMGVMLCHIGLVDEGLMLFQAMVSVYGIAANEKHYAYVVDLYASAWRLKEADDLDIYRTLVEKGATGGTLASVSNSYAGSNRWDESMENRNDYKGGHVNSRNVLAALMRVPSRDMETHRSFVIYICACYSDCLFEPDVLKDKNIYAKCDEPNKANLKDLTSIIIDGEEERFVHEWSRSLRISYPCPAKHIVAKSSNWSNNGNKKADNNKRFGNFKNNRGPNPNLHYTNCQKVGHTVDRCFDIIVYPPGYVKNPGPKSTGPRTFNANSVSSSNEKGTSLSFTNEQMLKLMNLIIDSPSGSVQANMAGRASFFKSNVFFNINFKIFYNNNSVMCKITLGWIIDSGANQHMTVSTLNMFEIIDISDLNFTVGHPNGTVAKIQYVGNLKLFEKIVLFDVLVVPEYCVSLLSVNKLIKDSRMFVGFSETNCFIQDLHQNKIVRTGSENDGLYMFDSVSPFSSNCQTIGNLSTVCYVFKFVWHTRHGHPSNQVVDMLHQDLNFTKDSHVSPCDICHKAKQTREPFPLSDHQTTSIGELIHLDLWGPYKVTTSVLNDKSPFELVYGFKPKLSHLRSFGCLCFSSILNSSDKFSPKSEKCVLIGFSTTKKAYKVYSLESKVVFYSRDKHSDFQSPLSPNDDGRVFQAPNDEGSTQPCSSSPDDSEVDLATSMGDNSSSEGNVPSNSGPLSQSDFPGNNSQGLPDLRRSSRNVRQPARFNDYVVNSSKKYGLEKYVTYSRSNCEIERYKARVVAKGFSQREGFDYLETFSPVVKMSTVRCMLNVAICNKWDLFQLDINNAFLYGDLTEDSKYDYSLFTKKSDNVFIMLLVYVDDIVITENDVNEIDKISSISIGSLDVQPSESPYLPVLFIGTSQSRQHDKSESVSYYLTN
ncbi:retrovirus-related pol polyprotein from transposon TNT 1-94 [Tanacetum coccineum]